MANPRPSPSDGSGRTGCGNALLRISLIGGLIKAIRQRNQSTDQDERNYREQAELAEAIKLGHEQNDVSARNVALAGAALVALLVVIALGLLGFYNFLASRAALNDGLPAPLADPEALSPGPRLQANPARDWQQLREDQLMILNSYGWANRDAGIVRVPIDQAMELVLEEGLPVREGGIEEYTFDGFTSDVPDLESSGGLEWWLEAEEAAE